MLNAVKHLYRATNQFYHCGRDASTSGRQMSMTFLLLTALRVSLPRQGARPQLRGAAEKGIRFNAGAVPATVRSTSGWATMPLFAPGFQPENQRNEWEGGPSGGASQETCPDIHRFSIRGGRMEKESSSYLPVAELSTVFRPRPGGSFLLFEANCSGF